ncbi:MAG: SlyX family protein [Deltaproteobacteria bacterium]|nr:SlyX family protein [Deltaproteobacteria bacterium]
MSPIDELAERVMDLEVRLAYQDKTIATLDGVVRALADKVDHLSAELRQVRKSMDSPEGALGPASEKPPHF